MRKRLFAGMVACAAVGALATPASAVTAGVHAADPPPTGAGVSDVEVDIVVPDSAGELEAAAPVPTVSADEGSDLEVTAEYLSADRVETPIVEVDAFQTLGVTWPADSDASGLDVEVRTRTDGQWSEWTPLGVSDAAPDEATPEAEHVVRGGTEAFWAGQADAAQVSFAAAAIDGQQDVSLSLVDVPLAAVAAPGTAVGPPAAPGSGSGDATVGPLQQIPGAEGPRVITRAEWGAAAPLPDDTCGGMTVASTLVGAVVHHTAGPNSYSTTEEAMQQIRGDQLYHQKYQGWCDLGYNFVVDKWGNVYEGRAGSLTDPVVGVHAGGFNTATIGVAILGNYSAPGEDPNQSPEDVADSLPAEASEGVARIIAMRLGQYHRDPGGDFTYTKADGVTKKDLPVVFAHRDVSNTICPGTTAYAELGRIRTRARELVTPSLLNPAVTPASVAQGGAFTLTAPTLSDVVWWLRVVDAATGRGVYASGGLATEAGGGVSTTWTGQDWFGRPVVAGTYQLTLSGFQERTGRPVVPYSATVEVTAA